MTTLKEYLRLHYRPSVARSYGHRARQYREATAESEGAGYADVLAYVELLRRRGLHPKTLRNHVSAIKVYYDYLQAAGVREDHPCARLVLRDRVDRGIRLDELYGWDEMTAWLERGGNGNSGGDRRRQVAAGLFVHQALMSAEAARLRVEDVDVHAGTVYVTGGGKTDSRTLALKASQVMLVDGYVREVRPGLVERLPEAERSGRLLLTDGGRGVDPAGLNRLVNAGLPKAEKLLPLRIRQSVIAGLLDRGHDVRVVQALAGHKTATATEQYKRSEGEELAEAVRRLHPRG